MVKTPVSITERVKELGGDRRRGLGADCPTAQIKVRVPWLKGPAPNVTHNHKSETRRTDKP